MWCGGDNMQGDILRAAQEGEAQGVETQAHMRARTGPTSPMQVVREHDRRRRHRLVRIVALGLLVSAGMLIPSALLPSFNGPVFVTIVLAAIGFGAAYILSHRGQVDLAGILIVVSLAAAIGMTIVGKAFHQQGLDVSDLRLFDLFVLPILLCAVLVNRRAIVVMTICTGGYTVLCLLALPKTVALSGYLMSLYPVPASAVDAISVALFVQGITAVAAWLGADSMRQSLMDASRADEVVAANRRLEAQAREMQAQRWRLREAIARIQTVHAAVASGRWDARVTVEEGELLPVATSLNLLLDRLARLAREQGERSRLEKAAHALAEALRRARTGAPYVLPVYTGTAEDEVLVELSALLRDTSRVRTQVVSLQPAQPLGPKVSAGELFGIPEESLPSAPSLAQVEWPTAGGPAVPAPPFDLHGHRGDRRADEREALAGSRE